MEVKIKIILAKYANKELEWVDDGEFLHILSALVVDDWGEIDNVLGALVYLLREEARIVQLVDFLWPMGDHVGTYYRTVLAHKMLFYISHYDILPEYCSFHSVSSTGVWAFPWVVPCMEGVSHEQLMRNTHTVYDHELWTLNGNPTFPPVQAKTVVVDEADEEVSVLLRNHYNIDLIIPWDVQEKMDIFLDLISELPEHDNVISYMNRFSALVMKFVGDMREKAMDKHFGLEGDWDTPIIRYAQMKRSQYGAYDLKMAGGDSRVKLMLGLSAIAPSMRNVRAIDCAYFLRIMGALTGRVFIPTSDYIHYPCEKYGEIVVLTVDKQSVPRRRYIRACEQLCAIKLSVLLEYDELHEEVVEMFQELTEIIPVIIYTDSQASLLSTQLVSELLKKVKTRYRVVAGPPPPWVSMDVVDRQTLFDVYYYYHREWKKKKKPSDLFYAGEILDDEWIRDQVLADIRNTVGVVTVSPECVVSNGGTAFYQRIVSTQYGEYSRFARSSTRLRNLIESDFSPTVVIHWQ